MWLLTICCVLVLLISLRVRKIMKYWEARNIPYIKSFPIFGNSAPLVLRKCNFLDHLQNLYNHYPDKRCYGTFQFMSPQLLIRDPELIKQITVKDFDHFTDRTLVVNEDAEPILSKNLAGLKGHEWRDMRSALSPSFTSSKMKFLFTLICNCAEQFTNHFGGNTVGHVTEVEVKDAFSRFTNDAIATAAFGVSVNSLSDKENEFFINGKDVTTFRGLRVLRFIGYSIFPSLMRFFKVSIFPPAAANFLKRVIKETIQVREEKGIVRPDMIHILLEARKGKDKEEEIQSEGLHSSPQTEQPRKFLTDDDITAQALIFFFGGFETTSTLLSFLAYELAISPDIQDRLQEEIDKTVRATQGKLTYDVLLGMKYLDMVVSEALRRWTPGVALDRMCVKDYKIAPENPNEVPILIEKGTSVLIPVIGLHHDPQYFTNPYKFDPERFSDENKAEIVPFTYIPFGFGPRNCIASRFALLEVKILVFQLLQNFSLIPVEKTIIPMVINSKSFSMIPEGGIWLGFKQR